MADSLNIDVFDFLDKLGIENVHPASGGTEANYSCPFAGHAHGDERPSAYMNVETSAWFCWGCKERGRNAASFTAKVLGIDYTTASRFLREAYGVEFQEPEGGSMAGETEARFAPRPEVQLLRRPDPIWQENFVKAFPRSPACDYIIDRGLTRATCQEWGLGFDSHSMRLTIPVHDLSGELIGFKGRALEEARTPKYFILGDRTGSQNQHYGFDPYEASIVIFGLHRNRDIEEGIMSEGELNAIKLAQNGEPRPLATGMSYFSDRHALLAMRELARLIVFYDTDLAGGAGIWGHEKTASGERLPGMVERLQPHMPIELVPDHEGDPMSMDDDEARELINRARSSLAYNFILG